MSISEGSKDNPVKLDPFQLITSVSWGNPILVISLAGWAMQVQTFDKSGNQIDGLFNFMPNKWDGSNVLDQFGEIIRPGAINVPINGSDIQSSLRNLDNWTYIGRGLANPGEPYVVASLLFISIIDTFDSDFMNNNYTYIDGGRISYADQRSAFFAKWNGNQITDTIRSIGPGLINGVYAQVRYSLTYTAIAISSGDYQDLFLGSILAKFGNGVDKVVIQFNGNPQNVISVTAAAKAYNANSVFVPKEGGTVKVYTDQTLKIDANIIWSASDTMVSLNDKVSFNKSGLIKSS